MKVVYIGKNEAKVLESSNYNQKISLSTKAIFGLGSYATGIKENAFGVFLLFYYTQVIGLSGSLAGTAVLCALIIDAISDPVIGHWSDNFHSRWGRRHPFMYASIIPLAFSFIFLFNPPLYLSSSMTFLWMLVFAVAVRFSITFYSIPSSSMGAEMTSDYHERTSLFSFRVLFGWAGSLSMSFITYTWLFASSVEFEDGRFDPGAYQLYGFIGAAGIVVSILLSTLGTHHLIPGLHEGSKEGFSLKGLRKDLFSALQNKTFVILFVSILVMSVSAGFMDVFALYMNTFFWGFSNLNLSFLLLGALSGSVLAFVLIKKLSAHFGKKRLMLICIILTIVAGPVPVILRLMNLLPENGTRFILYLILFSTSVSVFIGVIMIILASSMVADTIDQNQILTGKRQEGMFYASTSFSAKATTGLGGFIAGIALDVIQFPQGVLASDIDAHTLASLGLANVLVIIMSSSIALLCMSKYSLTREAHARVLLDLKELASVEKLPEQIS